MMHSFLKILDTLFFPCICFVCKKNNETICTSCLQSLPRPLDTPENFILSRFSYKDKRVKKIIHAIKFFHRKDLIQPLASEMTLPLNEKDTSHYIVVPIPMPYTRKLFRGYNQSELLARALAQHSGLELDSSALVRKRSPSRQVTTLSRKERLTNQKNSFRATVHGEGKHYLLVDDVTTTGATLREARQALVDAGAASVHAVTIAH